VSVAVTVRTCDDREPVAEVTEIFSPGATVKPAVAVPPLYCAVSVTARSRSADWIERRARLRFGPPGTGPASPEINTQPIQV
jgi:hypothetical protein